MNLKKLKENERKMKEEEKVDSHTREYIDN